MADLLFIQTTHDQAFIIRQPTSITQKVTINGFYWIVLLIVVGHKLYTHIDSL